MGTQNNYETLVIPHNFLLCIVGEVKEKEQAHREYKEAIAAGHGAYLMDEEKPVSLENKNSII